MGRHIQVCWSEYLRLRSNLKGLILHEAKVVAQDHNHPYVLVLCSCLASEATSSWAVSPSSMTCCRSCPIKPLNARQQTGSHSLVKSSCSGLSYSWSYHAGHRIGGYLMTGCDSRSNPHQQRCHQRVIRLSNVVNTAIVLMLSGLLSIQVLLGQDLALGLNYGPGLHQSVLEPTAHSPS